MAPNGALQVEVPVSLVMVDSNGCTVVDLQAVPSPALMPALIPSHQRPVAKGLYVAGNMRSWTDEGNSLIKQAMKSLK